jgi:hypothetical protein
MKRPVSILLRAVAALLLAAALMCATLMLMVTESTHRSSGRLGRRAIELRLDGRRIFVSWRPLAPYRPTWAGQTNRYGFRYTRWSDGSAEIGLPLWLPAAFFTTLTLAAARLARPRKSKGLCPHCGYDLRATPDRCPECGAVFSSVASPAALRRPASG